MKRSRIQILPVALLAAACVGASDVSVEIGIDAPDGYIRGAVFELGAVYEADGVEEQVDVDDRVLESDPSFIVRVPAREQSRLLAIVTELRHPKYKPTKVTVDMSRDSSSRTVTLQPRRWTTNERNTFIQPAYGTAVAAVEHLDWIGEIYFRRPEWFLINEAFQRDHRLVAMLAYGGGGKTGHWEEVRLANIERWKSLQESMEERSYTPCPPGYEPEGFAHRPCGAEKLNITYYERDDGKAPVAAEEEWQSQVAHARADLAKRLQLNESAVQLGGYELRSYDPELAFCPDAGEPPNVEDEPGYEIIFSVRDRGVFVYLGRKGELPFYCRSRT